jgi:molybdopterin molybdotransferase
LPELPVHRRLRVGIFFTGDELYQPGEPLPPGGIYNSNRYALGTLLAALNCEVRDLGTVPDQLDATRDALRCAAAENDLIVTSGGVSVGEEDHVKPAVEAEGQLDMWKIAIKPGKPLAFGEVRRAAGEGNSGAGKAWFIGLPGNPVSAMVTFLMLVRPFILRLQGVQALTPATFGLRADFDWKRPDPLRTEFMRARMNAQGGVELFPNQGSGVVTSLCWGNGLVVNPPGRSIAVGDTVDFLPFAELS